MIVSLAFVPTLDVWNCLAQLEAYLPAQLHYFSHYYVGTLMNPPMFPVNIWSCYDKTLAGEDRTNNFAEAAHRRLQDAVGVEHLTVGRLLQDLKEFSARMTSTTSNTLREWRLHESAGSTEKLMLESYKQLSAIVRLTSLITSVDWLTIS